MMGIIYGSFALVLFLGFAFVAAVMIDENKKSSASTNVFRTFVSRFAEQRECENATAVYGNHFAGLVTRDSREIYLIARRDGAGEPAVAGIRCARILSADVLVEDLGVSYFSWNSTESHKSTATMAGRAVVGGVLFGPLGAAVGAATAPNKSDVRTIATHRGHTVTLQVSTTYSATPQIRIAVWAKSPYEARGEAQAICTLAMRAAAAFNSLDRHESP